MITFQYFIMNYLNEDERCRVIKNTRNFRKFFREYKKGPALFTLMRAINYNKSEEGREYWKEILSRITDVVVTKHPNGEIKSIIPIYKGQTKGTCYFIDINGVLIRTIDH